MKILLKHILVVAMVCLASNIAWARTMTPDEGRVIYVKANELGKVVGVPIDSLSLMSIQNGKFHPIPSQIDEMTEEGYVYFEEGSYKNPGEQNIFDAQDVLMFMLKDAGSRKTSQKVNEGTLLAELEVEHYNGKKSYVYLVRDALISSMKFMSETVLKQVGLKVIFIF